MFIFEIQFQLEEFRLNACVYILELSLCEAKIKAKFRWHYISVWSLLLNLWLFLFDMLILLHYGIYLNIILIKFC